MGHYDEFNRGVQDAQRGAPLQPGKSEAYTNGYHIAKQEAEQALRESREQRGVKIA